MKNDNVKHLGDEQLLSQIKVFVQSERDAIIKVLHHLREIERRRLFCDLGYQSLFDYAVKELRYSEGQASRRIQAMRLIKDIPEIESKIASGDLNLTNVQQAQSLFREIQSADPRRIIAKEEKLAVLSSIENKSVREAQKELAKLNPEAAIPKERERIVTETVSELRMPMTDTLKAKLEEVRSHLGLRGATMSYADLFEAMADVSLKALKARRFGKKRSKSSEAQSQTAIVSLPKKAALPAAPEVARNVTAEKTVSSNPRYIGRADKHTVWQHDQGRCRQCLSTKNLNFDHIVPVAKGGRSTPDNLRLLCFACNQRASTKIFGRIFST